MKDVRVNIHINNLLRCQTTAPFSRVGAKRTLHLAADMVMFNGSPISSPTLSLKGRENYGSPIEGRGANCKSQTAQVLAKNDTEDAHAPFAFAVDLCYFVRNEY